MSGEKSILKDVGLYKNRLISSILNSTNICETLLIDKECTEENIDNLVYTQVFPYLYVDETQTSVLPYLCMEVNIPRIPTNTIKNVQVVLWVYAHKDCMQYSKKGYLGTRVDILSDMIMRELSDSDKFGIGKLELQSVRYIFPSTKYYGRELILNTSDFKVKDVKW